MIKPRRNARPDRAGPYGVECLEGRALLSGVTQRRGRGYPAGRHRITDDDQPQSSGADLRHNTTMIAWDGQRGKRLPSRPPSNHRCWKNRTCSVTGTRSRAWS